MKVTITDIAKTANVSVATVSRVINNKSKGVSEKTRERIQGIIVEYDFQPSAVARGLVTKKSKIKKWVTTVNQPSYEMGCKAANLLIDIVEGKPTSMERKVVLLSKLVIRDSVKNLLVQ